LNSFQRMVWCITECKILKIKELMMHSGPGASRRCRN
jgi:endonuclease IV